MLPGQYIIGFFSDDEYLFCKLLFCIMDTAAVMQNFIADDYNAEALHEIMSKPMSIVTCTKLLNTELFSNETLPEQRY